jgi:serine/threonine protein kinase
MDTHRLALVAGYRLEHYQIERILGKGGFGITYVAIDTHLGKRVAIKELRAEGATVVSQTESMLENWQWARERFLGKRLRQTESKQNFENMQRQSQP